jgi:dihydrofolate reductase
MNVSIIAALDQAGGIGKDNKLPWKLKDDQKRFKRLTMGHYIIMGRKTYESIGKPLPGRQSIIITKNQSYYPQGCLISNSIEHALSIARDDNESEAFIIGGGEVFSQSIELANRMYLTIVNATTDCDVYFPEYRHEDWIEKWTVYQPENDDNQYSSIFKSLVRIT